MDSGHAIDINRRRRGDSEGGGRWDNVYSLCVRRRQKIRGKRQRDMRPVGKSEDRTTQKGKVRETKEKTRRQEILGMACEPGL